MVHTNPEFETSNLILDFEFDQHLESHKHVINIIMWFRDMGCYNDEQLFVENLVTIHEELVVVETLSVFVPLSNFRWSQSDGGRCRLAGGERR
jgi:hypothetical protein